MILIEHILIHRMNDTMEQGRVAKLFLQTVLQHALLYNLL